MASAAILGGLSGASSLLGGLFGSKGANEAAKTINLGTLGANANDYRLYGQQRADQAPYMQAGAGAVNYLQYLLGIGGGPNGQVAPSAASNFNQRLYGSPTASAMAGMDGKNGTIKANGNGFSWVPGSGNARGYTFLYNDGVNDVYQRSSGGKGTGINIDYAVVGKDGKVNFAPAPPLPGSNAPQGGPQITDAMKNDPNFGSLMKDFSSSDFQTDPGYQFRLAEGQKALERSAASKGALFSGGTLKDLTNFNQGAASQEYGNAYNRYQTNRATKFNQLAATAGLGQTSAQTINNATGNLIGQTNQNTMYGAGNEANAIASGYSAMGKGIGGAINSVGNGLVNWYQLSQQGKPGAINSQVG